MVKNQINIWVFALYITIACSLTAGLNIVHTKYILGIPLYPELFIVPTVAGVIFGYLTARIRLASYNVGIQNTWQIFAKYILFSCLVTSGLNIVHTEWVLGKQLSSNLFVAPLIAGVFFGYLLARIKSLNNNLLHLATTDPLTQLCNRMQFEVHLSQEIEKVARYGGTFSLIYFDVDNFKKVNDQYGHQKGDEVLSLLASHVNSLKRKCDIFARYGGDELIILAPFTNLESAQKQAKLLCQSINNISLDPIPRISCSFGVVEYAQSTHNADKLIGAVDKALYEAKNIGRNCIVAA